MTSPVPEHETAASETAPVAPEDVVYESKAARRKAAWRALGWRSALTLGASVTAVAALVGFAIAQAIDREDPPVIEAESAETQAVAACKAHVLENLKAPATAVFVSGTALTAGGGRFSVRGEVDAQNGFGALIRSDYYCVLDQRRGDWALVTITIT